MVSFTGAQALLSDDANVGCLKLGGQSIATPFRFPHTYTLALFWHFLNQREIHLVGLILEVP